MTINGVILTPLKILHGPLGSVMHALRSDSPGYAGFGEAYFSSVSRGAVKGWKRHQRMTLNLVVPTGAVQFVIYDDREESPSRNQTAEVTLSRDNYQRLTVPPRLWVAFRGVAEENILLNLASITHDPQEAQTLPIETDYIPYAW